MLTFVVVCKNFHKLQKIPPEITQEAGSGGALYIMFENHVRSWPLLKTSWYTRGYMSKYLCIQMYSVLNICLM